ncbi:hypothetical protein VTL71DRAFT_8785 [Oculimacula yallundae]|uniref:Uncharacterized protein n=1 Tax=Oculimacula yallundae TaxID=86028 RepID=A0ABR4CYP7_9HELO
MNTVLLFMALILTIAPLVSSAPSSSNKVINHLPGHVFRSTLNASDIASPLVSRWVPGEPAMILLESGTKDIWYNSCVPKSNDAFVCTVTYAQSTQDSYGAMWVYDNMCRQKGFKTGISRKVLETKYAMTSELPMVLDVRVSKSWRPVKIYTGIKLWYGSWYAPEPWHQAPQQWLPQLDERQLPSNDKNRAYHVPSPYDPPLTRFKRSFSTTTSILEQTRIAFEKNCGVFTFATQSQPVFNHSLWENQPQQLLNVVSENFRDYINRHTLTFIMRQTTHYALVVMTSLAIVLTSLTVIILAAPATAPTNHLTTLSTSTLFNSTTAPSISSHQLTTRDNLTIAVEQGGPENGETLRPEPTVSFLSCKPRVNTASMCTLAFVQKRTDTSCVVIAYDHKCNRLDAWKTQRNPLSWYQNGAKHGTDLVSPKLKWNILLYMSTSWNGFFWSNHDVKVAYGSYVSFPFYWKDYPAKWRESRRINSGNFKDQYYDFFRVPFTCRGEFV